jgi:hypothetical protein
MSKVGNTYEKRIHDVDNMNRLNESSFRPTTFRTYFHPQTKLQQNAAKCSKMQQNATDLCLSDGDGIINLDLKRSK